MLANQDNPLRPHLRRFELVTVINHDDRLLATVGDACGTVIWADPPQMANRSAQWTYCVCFSALGRYVSIVETNLRSAGRFDLEEAHVGREFELSHDLLPGSDGAFEFVEGTYRLPGKFWEVMIFAKWNVPALQHRPMTWDSGMTGITFAVPKAVRLDKAYVERAMSAAFNADRWIEVQEPDSMILR